MKKRIFAIVMFALLAVPVFAQDAPVNLYGFGVSYAPGAETQVAGSGMFARKAGDAGTYAITAVDVLPIARKPFTVSTSFSAGVAQRVFTVKKADFFTLASAGLSATGSNTGFAWSGGGAVFIPVKSSFALAPNVRFVKSAVSNGAGYQPVFGLMFILKQ